MLGFLSTANKVKKVPSFLTTKTSQSLSKAGKKPFLARSFSQKSEPNPEKVGLFGQRLFDFQRTTIGSPVFKIPVEAVEILEKPIDFYSALYVVLADF